MDAERDLVCRVNARPRLDLGRLNGLGDIVNAQGHMASVQSKRLPGVAGGRRLKYLNPET